MSTLNTNRQHLPWYTVLILLLGGSLLACTLAPASAPPTLSPRQTATPMPTIGYATIAPQSLPALASPPAPTQPMASTNPGVAPLMNLVDATQLMIHVRALTEFYTRHVNSSSTNPNRGIGAARTYIKSQFDQIAAQSQGRTTVFEQSFDLEWAGERTTQQNIVAVIRGTQPGAGTVIIGAHYDSRGDDDTDGNAYAPGANDNATGVSAIIEMTRILSQQSHRATIVFVAFSAEEVGRQGSIIFVNDYVRRNNIDVKAYINVDAIGSQTYANGAVNDSQIRVFSQGPNNASVSRQLARMAEMAALNYVPQMEVVVQDAFDRRGRYGDHFSFQEAGYPALRFIEMAENTSLVDTTDTIEGITPSYFARSVQTLIAVVKVMADGPPPPANVSLRDNGNGTQTLVWTASPGAADYVVALRAPNALIYQQFDIPATSVTWDGFAAYAAVAVAAKDENGLMGMFSPEITIQPETEEVTISN